MATLFRRSAEALSADVGDDVVALHVPRGFAYGMENVTAAVWQLIGEAKGEDEIVAALLADYDVDEARCRDEVGTLLRQLVDEGLAERIEA